VSFGEIRTPGGYRMDEARSCLQKAVRRGEERLALMMVSEIDRAGVDKQPRPFHDLRHTAITNDAAAGSSPIAVMTKAGHSNMSTTKRYLHLAGVVFRDEADALERRLGLSTELSTETGEHLR
jgi:integrase